MRQEVGSLLFKSPQVSQCQNGWCQHEKNSHYSLANCEAPIHWIDFQIAQDNLTCSHNKVKISLVPSIVQFYRKWHPKLWTDGLHKFEQSSLACGMWQRLTAAQKLQLPRIFSGDAMRSVGTCEKTTPAGARFLLASTRRVRYVEIIFYPISNHVACNIGKNFFLQLKPFSETFSKSFVSLVFCWRQPVIDHMHVSKSRKSRKLSFEKEKKKIRSDFASMKVL